MVWCVPLDSLTSLDSHLLAVASLPRFPVNLLFVCMIGTSFYALKAVGVGMVRGPSLCFLSNQQPEGASRAPAC